MKHAFAEIFPPIKLNDDFLSNMLDEFDKYELQLSRQGKYLDNIDIWKETQTRWIIENTGLIWNSTDDSFSLLNEKLYAFALLRYS